MVFAASDLLVLLFLFFANDKKEKLLLFGTNNEQEKSEMWTSWWLTYHTHTKVTLYIGWEVCVFVGGG